MTGYPINLVQRLIAPHLECRVIFYLFLSACTKIDESTNFRCHHADIKCCNSIIICQNVYGVTYQRTTITM